MLASSISGPWTNKALAWSLSSILILDTPFSPLRLLKSFQVSVLVVYAALYALARLWLGHVINKVQDPYLDEIFHIPQAQAYCNGRYEVWDPKLTTPPGLYIFATIYSKAVAYGKCSPAILRSFNIFALIMVFSYACDCRALIVRTRRLSPRSSAENVASQIDSWIERSKPLSPNEIHTALNIALFPLLFFFTGLFYTDVLSTCLVLRVYRLFLERKGAYRDSGEGLFWIYPTGIVALWMRQTNIFWVAVFLGGLEVVRTIEANRTVSVENEPMPYSSKDLAIFHCKRYSRGNIHDIPLKDAGVHDFILCAISIAIAALSCPIVIVSRLWPYIGLLASFFGFVFWNGGVVLGDKANHVATIHLPQMLYLWPFIALFSAPLIVPVAISSLYRALKLLSLPLFPRLVWQYLSVATYSALALAATLAIIKFNTIIHPFTLADNRHYMFYVFRYTILRHPLIRYLAAPVYLISGYLVYLTLCSQPLPRQTSSLKTARSAVGDRDIYPAAHVPTTTTDRESVGPNTSFVIILLATTALALITAPLVEPRYFILPWVIWRLHVPALPSPSQLPSQPTPKSQNAPAKKPLQALLTRFSFFFRGWHGHGHGHGHDPRLYLETAWFLLINAATAYMFLYRGFEWAHEPGTVQRFMWI
ncbi:hypothetical protein LZ554_001678 [Drepanopeziza brunnea f. sp. 'monogermtubi']|nr:hypothetical protein LZ554_001678 [Drepanopeziza brunnea f. sp. 'monogermtubi']